MDKEIINVHNVILNFFFLIIVVLQIVRMVLTIKVEYVNHVIKIVQHVIMQVGGVV